MDKSIVSIVDYETPRESVARAVRLCGGEALLSRANRVFIKPNVVFWTRHVPFPKYGVITTSRVVADMVVLLRDLGVKEIIIGEGGVARSPRDKETFAHAYEALGYGKLAQRYGVKLVHVLESEFVARDLGHGITLNFCKDALDSDCVVSLPAMKTHNQTVVSLGIKNLKGLIDMKSRKTCHNPDPERDLHFHVSLLARPFARVFTLIDGIFSLERGPGFDGKMHRSNTLIASTDALAADQVGASALGYAPEDVPYIAHAAKARNRSLELSDIQITGNPLRSHAHAHDFTYEDDDDKALPLPMARKGMTGLFYRKYDSTMCTYCSGINGVVLSAVNAAWKGQRLQRVEVLTGKQMAPAKDMEATILLGKCMVRAHKDHPDIHQMIPVKGCPPQLEDIAAAFERAGVPLDRGFFDQIDRLPGFFLAKVKDRPEFDDSFFRVEDQ